METEKHAKDFIIEGLLMLMAKKPYSDITITEIAERAGVNRVTFYRNFTTKDEVIDTYLSQCDQKFEACNNSEPENGLYQMLKYFEQNREAINLIYRSNAEPVLLKHILGKWGYNQTKDNLAAYIQSAWAYFMVGWASEWHRRGMRETPEELAEIAKKMKS